jgi:hypothetical protein
MDSNMEESFLYCESVNMIATADYQLTIIISKLHL